QAEDGIRARNVAGVQTCALPIFLRQFQPAEGEVATLKTNMGDIKLMFFPQEAPKCVENFLPHAKNGYYNGVIFHRVIKDFMIQRSEERRVGTWDRAGWTACCTR